MSQRKKKSTKVRRYFELNDNENIYQNLGDTHMHTHTHTKRETTAWHAYVRKKRMKGNEEKIKTNPTVEGKQINEIENRHTRDSNKAKL